MASFVVVVVVCLFVFLLLFFFWGGGGRGCYVLFEKDFFFSFFDGKSVMSALCTYYYMCMFV